MARQTVEERRAQLLKLGRELFSTHAYDAISTDDIARAAGISKGLLYHYFPGKREYYVATVQSLADELLAHLTFAHDEEVHVVLDRTLGQFIDFIDANSAMYQALLRGGIGMDSEVNALVERVRRTVLERIRDLVGLGDDPLTRLRLYGWLGFAEATSLEWLAHREVDRGRLMELWMEQLVVLAA